MNKIKQLLCLLVFAPVLASATSTTSDNFTFYYYTPDHLGNIREVVDASGNVLQVTNYYPFGATYADAATNADFQPYKYNGKERFFIEISKYEKNNYFIIAIMLVYIVIQHFLRQFFLQEKSSRCGFSHLLRD
jgi:uncharacterized protein RhaS with RHS repeats